jgi:flavin-dependent dehydrogenase
LRAAVIDRGAFDAELAGHAAAAGADIRVGSRVDRVHVSTTGVSVHTHNRGVIHARAVVLACGANYRFNRALGLGVPRAYIQSAQLEAAFDGPDHVEVFFGRKIAPGGFAWTVPFMRDGRRVNRIGLMCEERASALFARFAESLRARHALDGAPWQGPRTKILPLGPVSKTYATRLLAVGDAAGLVKPTTGGGIYYSLISGQMAADVLDPALHADALDDGRLREYEERWRARLGSEIRIGLKFRALASRLSDRAIDSLVELARIDGLVPLLKQTADFNWHGTSALALLRHAQFRKILFASIWG